ncbi:hypothetical protein [Prochlorococcus marinus]|uniref:hypothetical protein n=1 Tax=Prochlorococcus marinus TaxID=1219 RepID=UPI0007BC7D02|nr:hypothetical protein [Prochlorococcus marinus]KZR75907.1 hypothetical protein PMIT1320_00901 [Prochlorococcus marinus str. MIT 1320]
MAMLVYCVKIGKCLHPIMALQAILVHSTAQGGTIHKFTAKQGERFLGCYLGTCKFSNNIAEATADLASLEPSVKKSES